VLARLPLLVGLTLLALAIALGSTFIADGIRDRNRNDVITVTGSAKKRITSDYVVWDLSVTSRNQSAGAAAKQLSGWTARVQAFLRDEGIEAGELQLQPVSTEAPGEVTQGQVPEYRLTRSFEIRSSRVASIGTVAEDTSKLLTEGVPLEVQPPQYVFTKLGAVRPGLLAAATKDAQQRARVLVAASGAHLGGIRGVNVGVFQVTSPNSTEVSDYGVYDTSTVQKDVTAVVNVTFALS
jgi:hypothetical protein